MKRIFLMFLKNLFYFPGMLIKIHYYAHHLDKYDQKFLYDYIRDVTMHALKAGKVTVKAIGDENIPSTSSFIFYPNHQGFFDALAIIAVNPRPVSIIYKENLRHIPFLKSVLLCLNAIPIDRDDIRQSLSVINTMADKVKSGSNFIIFSEGTRSRNGNSLLPFKGGSFKAAYRSQCIVCPVALIDSYKVFDTGSIRPVTVTVKFLKGMEYNDYRNMKSVELAQLVSSQIQSAINSIASQQN